MKKILSGFLCVVIFLSCLCASAAGEETSLFMEKDVRFGMTREETIEVLGGPDKVSENPSAILFTDVPVETENLTLYSSVAYMFERDRLNIVIYDFAPGSDDREFYLLCYMEIYNLISDVYGETDDLMMGDTLYNAWKTDDGMFYMLTVAIEEDQAQVRLAVSTGEQSGLF